MSYTPNPSRGCGSKKHDAFYLEGAMGVGGGLYPWTWCLGDGLDNVVYLNLPPRQETFINPAATLASQGLYRADDIYVPVDDMDIALYGRLLQSTRNIGIGDHVGKEHYSAHQFAQECFEYGPSRRVDRNTALTCAALMHKLRQAGKQAALPILFTHPRVPIFLSERERVLAYQIALTFGWYGREWQENSHAEACWLMEDWGMYAMHDQYDGFYSQMIPILQVMEGIEKEWNRHGNDPHWVEAKRFYDQLLVEEQPIGLSWITQVSYTLPKNGQFDPALLEVPGLQFLNLEAVK